MPDDWRSDLVAKYPYLLKGAYPEVEDGWRDLVETAIARITAAIEGLPPRSVKMVQIKQKLGGIRLYWHASRLPKHVTAKIEEAIDLAEARSFVTCEICGEEGRLYDDHGWLTARCPLHQQGHPIPAGKNDGVIERYSVEAPGKRRLISRLKYDRARDSFIDLTNEEK